MLLFHICIKFNVQRQNNYQKLSYFVEACYEKWQAATPSPTHGFTNTE